MDAIDNTAELELEDTQTAEEDEGCELIDHEADDVETAFDDRLTAVQQARVRGYLPRHIQHAGQAEPDYCEVLIERPKLVDGSTVDEVSLALVDPELAPKAQVLCGTLETEFVNGDRLLELSYHYLNGEEPGFLFTLTLDGKYIKSFRSSALAQLCFRIIADHRIDRIQDLVKRVIIIFMTRAERRGETFDTCSEDFVAEVSHDIQDLTR